MSRHLRDVPDRHRYELIDDGRLLGFVSYRLIDEGPPEVRDLEHTVVEQHHRGEGVGGAIAAAVMESIRSEGIRAVVTCDYLRSWLEKHPESNDVVVEP